LLQDCPAGEKCMPWAYDGGNSWNALKCTPIDPNPKGVGETCTVEGSGVSGVDDCEKGAMCWDVDPMTLQGTCIAMCEGSPDAPKCAAPMSCVSYNDGVLNLCMMPCSIIEQDCSGFDHCVVTPDGCGTMCVPDMGGSGGFGTPCEYADACALGLICAPAAQIPGCQGATGCCTPYCDLDDPAASMNCPGAPATACLSYDADGMCAPGSPVESVGVCVAPP
jgi:hypothetical protein